jgi:hypothetical protein
MSDAVHPDDVLAQLLARTHRLERKKTLKGLHAICAAQAKSTKDFSRQAIGSLAEGLGVIKKKSLSNKGSAGLVTLIDAWDTYIGGDRPRTQDRVLTSIQDRLLTIPDPALRALIQGRLAERNKLQAQVNLLKAAVTIEVDRRVLPTSPLPNAAKQLEFAGSEVAAVRRVLSATFLTDEGWAEGKDGEVLEVDTGRRVFPKGFLTALRKVLATAVRS